MFCLFLLAKYIPVSRKNGGQKQEWRYPTACVGSYFIPDENIHISNLFAKLQHAKAPES